MKYAKQSSISLLWLLALATAPVSAQVDFTGSWSPLYHEDLPERLPGPELGEYMGIPINDAARMRADSYDADRISVVSEYQCRPHGADYALRGLANLRVDIIRDPETQQMIALHTRIDFQEMERTIWLDGRPHPSQDAPHTWQGFSAATWQNNMLSVYTTHLKESYLRRKGRLRLRSDSSSAQLSTRPKAHSHASNGIRTAASQPRLPRREQLDSPDETCLPERNSWQFALDMGR